MKDGEVDYLATSATGLAQCYHCGEAVGTGQVRLQDKVFCCTGCSTVFQILGKHGLCEYYSHAKMPGINQRQVVRQDKFAFLDDKSIATTFIQFEKDGQVQICFYLPQIHCSSCLWLLEHLGEINKGVLSSRVDFIKKEITVLFDHTATTVRKIAETLASIGYEPHISLQDLNSKAKVRYDRKPVYKVGVAGFCFSNIMMLSFPEYFGFTGAADEIYIVAAFKYIILFLSLPVLFYCASDFFKSGWQGLKHGFLNIDAPIALAIAITFGRSLYEILSGTGSGYLDSMSGIVFFMLAGRLLQDRTRQSLSFTRDYTSYFPIAVSRLEEDGKEVPVTLPSLRTGDRVVIHSNEIIPADGLLVKGSASIDYCFVTGESVPVQNKIGDTCYAGGRQVGGNIELLLVKDVSQSYLTGLWNKESMRKQEGNDDSFIHKVSQYFTVALFVIAGLSALWWAWHDATKIWPAVTAVLIVACPCALLLSSSFTNGHIINLFDKAGLYVRNAAVVERMCQISHIVFDKTGTLTNTGSFTISQHGGQLSPWQKQLLASLVAQSTHPLSRAVASYLHTAPMELEAVKETVGGGMEAWHNDQHILIGSPAFVGFQHPAFAGKTIVAFRIDNTVRGWFELQHRYRSGLRQMFSALYTKYKLSVISGDNDAAREGLGQLTGNETTLLFNQHPADKLQYTSDLATKGDRVMMVGDGLNDAGALQQSMVGIAVAEDINNFTPACDAVLQADKLPFLHKYLRLALIGKRVVYLSFAMSVGYNIIGLSFAVQAKLSPMIAAILMPASSISIIVFTWLAVQWAGRRIRPSKPVG